MKKCIRFQQSSGAADKYDVAAVRKASLKELRELVTDAPTEMEFAVSVIRQVAMNHLLYIRINLFPSYRIISTASVTMNLWY